MNTVKNNNDLFWTYLDNKLVLRNLRIEEEANRKNVHNRFHSGEIDEPILIYHEINAWKSGWHIDDCMYQIEDCIIQPGDHVLDLGANIGIFSSFATMKGAERIYAFEPISQNFTLLSLNTDDSIVNKYKLAIGSVDNHSVGMDFDSRWPGGSSFVVDNNNKKEIAMTITIDTLIANNIIERIDFLKMDIEGAEMHAFKGISDDNLKKIRCIAMEMHVNAIGEEESKKIYDRLNRLGFSNYTLWEPDNNNIVWFKNKALV